MRISVERRSRGVKKVRSSDVSRAEVPLVLLACNGILRLFKFFHQRYGQRHIDCPFDEPD